jgi:3-methyl-2-oxobutanoate hydroxymethyltransferase
MVAHGAAVVRGSWHAAVIVDLPFGTYEASPVQAFETASRVLRETGCAGVKLEGGVAMAETVAFLSQRGIPVMGHIGLTPQAVNQLGGYGARGRSEAEAEKIVGDARALADAGAFAIVVEGVVEPLAIAVTQAVACPVIGIGGSAQCDGQVLVTEDMLGMFERVPRFVKRYADVATLIADAAAHYARKCASAVFPASNKPISPNPDPSE